MKTLIFTSSLLSLMLLSGCGKPSASAPAPAATADAALMQVVDGLNQNNAAAGWNMLPASYQAELSEVKGEFAAKMDPVLWDSGASLVGKLHGVLESKKDLLLASPMMAQVPMSQDLSANYDTLVAILGDVLDSDLATLEGIETMDIGSFLSTTGSDIMKSFSAIEISDSSPKPMDMNSMLKMPGKILNTQAELVSEEGDTAVVLVTTEGEEPVEVPFVKVEGKWIPADMQSAFADMIEGMHESINEIEITPETKTQVQMGMSMVGGMLDQLATAKTQADLQAVMGGVMGMMMGGM
ncbi:hypothetical protein P3T73_00595 [Kiritimatiellota bacterium B12222]|nr:hypothetical protein P3T73_00595 [Kiritimatiellota bacterium B12222]